MTELPPALAPWRDDLAIFPAELALSLVPWIPRLALAVGPLQRDRGAASGAPDGFGGLARRGPYERLLLSEWLLALEEPDEFSRRAAMSEHAFLELTHREPAGAERSIVLFDAGPSQLGSPRIAQLALLVVLHRRAKSARAEFSWGVIQDPSGWTFDHLSDTAVLGLLRARTAHDATSADLEDWLDRLHPAARPDDLWLVGAPELAGLLPAAGASTIAVEDVLDPGARKVRIGVRRRRTSPRDVELDLPRDDACVRLIRDPFAVITRSPLRAPRMLAAGSSLLYAADGRALYARGEDGAIVLHRPPKTPRSQTSEPRILRPRSETFVAVGSFGKAHHVVTAFAERLWVRTFSKRGHWTSTSKGASLPEGVPFWHPGKDTPIASSFAPARLAAERGFLFCDPHGRLLSLKTAPEPSVSLVEWGIAAIGGLRGFVVMLVSHGDPLDLGGDPAELSTSPGKRYLAVVRSSDGKLARMPDRWDLAGDGELEGHFGHGGPIEDPLVNLLAVRKSRDTWQIFARGVENTVVLSRPLAVFGAGVDPATPGAPGLFGVEDDLRTISIATASSSRALTVAGDPIVCAVANPARPELAYLTRSGELTVYSLEHERPVLRVVGGAE